jgi:hypothetical protein
VSRYKGNSDKCKHCDLTYGVMRTGFSYYDIWTMLMDHSEDPADWKYKRRGTVLGMWHQTKKEMWERHLDECKPLRRKRRRARA